MKNSGQPVEATMQRVKLVAKFDPSSHKIFLVGQKKLFQKIWRSRMKKSFVWMFAVALVATSSTLNAQDAEATIEAQAAETVTAAAEVDAPTEAIADAPAEGVEQAGVPEPVADVAPVADGVAVVEGIPVEGIPVAGMPVAGMPVEGMPVAGMPVEGVIFDAAVVAGGFAGCCEPVQACCDCCCDGALTTMPQGSFVEPVVFNQPIFAQSSTSQTVPSSVVTSVVNPAPAPVETVLPVTSAPVYSPEAVAAPATYTAAPIESAPIAPMPVASAPVTSGCSSCSGGGIVSYAPAPVMSESFVSAPVQSAGCSSCGAPAAPVACDPCQNSRRFGFRGGFLSRLRTASGIASAIDDN